MWTTPNVFTITRVVLIPFVIIFFYLSDYRIISTLLFLFLAVTDWLDGFLARYFDKVTSIGEFLDPIADKLLVISAILLLSTVHNNCWFLLCTTTIIAREIVVLTLREWVAVTSKGLRLKVNMLGKIKTASQMAAIFLLLLETHVSLAYFWRMLGPILFFITALISVCSMFVYISAAYKIIRQSEQS